LFFTKQSEELIKEQIHTTVNGKSVPRCKYSVSKPTAHIFFILFSIILKMDKFRPASLRVRMTYPLSKRKIHSEENCF
jgi:hypothetical protein